MTALFLPGGMLVLGPCWSCSQSFAYDPYNVATVAVDPASGELAAAGEDAEPGPICPGCRQKIERDRAAAGLPPAWANIELIVMTR